MWARWLLTILAFVVLILVGRGFVHDSEGASGPTNAERTAEVEANREGDIVVEEDQAPHAATLRLACHADSPSKMRSLQTRATGFRAENSADRFRACAATTAGSPSGGRQAFHCTVRSSDIAYRFLAVFDAQTHQLTWCKVDPPANGATAIPVSARCRA